MLAAAVLAIILANSPLAAVYNDVLRLRVTVAAGDLALDKSLLHWINDGLMAVFFLTVGLEIKREILEGTLSSRDQVVLPVAAALGGFLLPAAIYVAVNVGDPVALEGWAIPSATDIAFALGVLALLGDRVPLALKVFVTALAIIDDLLAIVVIAVFYSGNLSLLVLALAGAGVLVLVLFNRLGVRRAAPYLLVGLVIWVCVLRSGVHATLAGVLVALAIPLRGPGGPSGSPARRLEHDLEPWVAFGVLPAFAFANAGVSLSGVGPATFLAPVPLGIALGLFLGKQAGVFGVTWAVIASGLARRPEGTTWPMLYGAAVLTGIGFTMSLFIGALAFEKDVTFQHEAAVRLGVLAGSLLSGILGYLVLRFVTRGGNSAS